MDNHSTATAAMSADDPPNEDQIIYKEPGSVEQRQKLTALAERYNLRKQNTWKAILLADEVPAFGKKRANASSLGARKRPANRISRRLERDFVSADGSAGREVPSQDASRGPTLSPGEQEAALFPWAALEMYQHTPLQMGAGSRAIRLLELERNCVHARSADSDKSTSPLCSECAGRGRLTFSLGLGACRHIPANIERITFPWNDDRMCRECVELWIEGLESVRIVDPSLCSRRSCEEKVKATDAFVRFRLVDVSLDSEPQYEALSYPWGSAEYCQRVLCGTKVMMVTENCYRALRKLRLPCDTGGQRCSATPRTLWIDGICIDQGSLVERGHQVNLMAQVYTKASEVILWPGPESEVIFQHPEQLRSHLFDLADTSRPVAQSVLDFLDGPYFRRIWPIQELVLSQVCRGLAGDCTLPRLLWPTDISGKGKSGIGVLPYALSERIKLLRKLWTHFRSRKIGHSKADTLEDMRISRVLLDARDLQSSEPRDKIFALQGLLERMGVTLCPTDYTRPVATIFREAAIGALMHDRDLGVLAGLTGHRIHTDLPSWVPDWSDSDSVPEVADWDSATAAGSSSCIFDHTLTHDTRCLSIQGVIIDSIAHVIFEFPHTPSLAVDAFVEYLRRPIDDRLSDRDEYLDVLHALCLSTWDANLTSNRYPLRNAIRRILGEVQPAAAPGRTLQNTVHTIRHSLVKRLDRKIFFKTRHGRLGLVSRFAQVGDEIALLRGCNLPMIIRPNGDTWTLVAPAMVKDELVMKGGLWDTVTQLDEYTFA